MALLTKCTHFSYCVTEDKLARPLQCQGFTGFQRQLLNVWMSTQG